MLLLSRKRGESIVVQIEGRIVEISVQEIRGDKCRLGFVADRDIVIHRREVAERIAAAAACES